MFKRHAKTTKRVTVYQPHILDAARSKKPVELETSIRRTRTIPEAVGDLLVVIFLGLLTSLVIMVGNMPTARRTDTPVRLYDSAILAHTLGTVNRLPSRAKDRHGNRRPQKIVALKPAVQKLPIFSCVGRTVMNIVAHEDDDLLFINPDISRAITEHNCVRTVYVTAGDDGRGADYLAQRETGSRAAYNIMLHRTGAWDYQKLALSSGVTVTVASPRDNANVSLVFLRLPDGNLDGNGFPATGYQSIARLRDGAVDQIASVDGSQTYTSDQLVGTLVALMEQYQPVRINTQADDSGLIVADHSDHITTGEYTRQAAAVYMAQVHSQVAVRQFMGYPIRAMLPNLSPSEIAQKSAAFFAYAVDDPGVCTSMQICSSTHSSYGFYLGRQYLGANQ